MSRLGLVAAIAVMAVACGDDATGRADESPGDDSIVGTWLIDSIDGAPVIDGSTVTLVVGNDGNASANTGCNQVSTQFKIDGNALTVTAPTATTLMACPTSGLAAQERTYLAALESTVTFEIDGDGLTLRAGDDIEVLRATRVSSALEGTSWTAIRVDNGRGGIQSPIPGTEITVDFGTDGTISGSGGCNTYAGTVEIDDDAITVTNVEANEMYCAQPDGIMEQERLFLAALERVAIVQRDGLNVRLRDSGGSALIMLVAA